MFFCFFFEILLNLLVLWYIVNNVNLNGSLRDNFRILGHNMQGNLKNLMNDQFHKEGMR